MLCELFVYPPTPSSQKPPPPPLSIFRHICITSSLAFSPALASQIVCLMCPWSTTSASDSLDKQHLRRHHYIAPFPSFIANFQQLPQFCSVLGNRHFLSATTAAPPNQCHLMMLLQGISIVCSLLSLHLQSTHRQTHISRLTKQTDCLSRFCFSGKS